MMYEALRNDNAYIGYEYRDVTVSRSMESLYVDSYESFGWHLDGKAAAIANLGLTSVVLKFKRDRKIRNKAELTRLQRQFDATVNEILAMERSKTTLSSIVAYTVGIVGCAFMAGSVFAFLAGLIPLCIVLAIPGFLGWVLPYFLYESVRKNKSAQLTPLIEQKYDECYDICEKASTLLP